MLRMRFSIQDLSDAYILTHQYVQTTNKVLYTTTILTSFISTFEIPHQMEEATRHMAERTVYLFPNSPRD